MKKVGILTHYYKNLNYGGTLQSYALCKTLNRMGVNAKQISYDMFFNENNQKKNTSQKLTTRIRRYAKLKRRRLNAMLDRSTKSNVFEQRKNSFYKFQKQIPHTKKVYNNKNISDTASHFDIFITGSDQVWNTKWYNSAFFLDFVPDHKKKISYAASLGKTQIDKKTHDIFSHSLHRFNAISVREKDAIDMVSPYTNLAVVQALDPTMLLSSKEWDKICTPAIINEKYIFCFLLGDGKNERSVVQQFANKTGFKIVTLPHFPTLFREADENFADISLYEISPPQFISLIKHAEYVFTDSFHAAVFSNLYEKEYFVFERKGKTEMRSRIVSLLELYDSECRFLDSDEKMTYSYMQNVPKTDFNAANNKLQKLREESLAFLRNNLIDK